MSRPHRLSLRSVLVVVLLTATAGWLLLWLTGRRVTKAELYPAELARVPPAAADVGQGLEPLERPRNLIVFVADGLGFAHLAAGRAALGGIDGAVGWDRLPTVGWHRPHPIDGLLTDSAASGTALATGHPTINGAVAMDADGNPLTTLFERAADLGYRTGVVTDSYIWDATPAAFVTHAADRDHAALILEQLAASDLDVLFGELEDVGEDAVPEWAATEALLAERFSMSGPEPVSADQLLAADPARPVAAIFEEEQITDLASTPSLRTLAQAGLRRLDGFAEPFVLLVESEELDSASHRRDLDRVLRGLEAIEATLTDLIDFAERDGETLLVFTSDHETGGLAISTVRGNRSLKALWGTNSHSAVAVPLMALGPGAERFSRVRTNWEVGRLLAAQLGPTGRASDEENPLVAPSPDGEE